jgi:hypothetical protein
MSVLLQARVEESTRSDTATDNERGISPREQPRERVLMAGYQLPERMGGLRIVTLVARAARGLAHGEFTEQHPKLEYTYDQKASMRHSPSTRDHAVAEQPRSIGK